MSEIENRIASAVSQLTLEQKVTLLTGQDFWNLTPIENIGLRNLLMSDGPAGVRGEFWDERDNSLNLPSGTSLGSTWSRKIASEYGEILAVEADRKGVDVVLGPTINLHRSPLGGRHFESLSEDPLLTGELASSYVKGMQAQGKSACPKHYIANDFETERFTANVTVDDRTLRELYMRPFEDAVVDGKAWTLMSSYNSINGTTASESDILRHPLKTEWGFDGVVVSDWTAVRTIAAAQAEQDLAMPGPFGPWGQALIDAINAGEVDEATIDRKVVRILRLAFRVGAMSIEGKTPKKPTRHNDISDRGVAFARKAAIAGSVLLANDGVLPFDPGSLGKVALIGHNAEAARTQGGGSATTHPKSVSTPLAELRNLFGDRLTYSRGAIVQDGIAALDPEQLRNPVTGGRGVRVDFVDSQGEVIYSEDREASNLMWLGSQAPVDKADTFRIYTTYTPDFTGTEKMGFSGTRPSRLVVDGVELFNLKLDDPSGDPFIAVMDPPFTSTDFAFEAGKSVGIELSLDMRNRVGMEEHLAAASFGFEPDKSNPQDLIDEAVAAAKASELAIVVVGTNSQVESEGFDRKNLCLPGRQDELVAAVVAANPNTVVIVNSGSPVILPWAKDVRAILLTYFGGQEMGKALVDMLTGAAEPGGRLPTTWAAQESDVPVINCTPHNDQIEYTEGLHIGYRAWLKAGAKPLYAFGHGLGYTTFTISELSVGDELSAGQSAVVTTQVTNTGSRSGRQVVQVYLRRAESNMDRPALWLAGFEEVELAAGQSAAVKVNVKAREFAHWAGSWQYESGQFEVLVGSASDELTSAGLITVS